MSEIPSKPKTVKVKLHKPKKKAPFPDHKRAGSDANDLRYLFPLGSLLWKREILAAVASVIWLAVILLIGYIRFVKGIDVVKEARDRLAMASCVLFQSSDHVVMKRGELNRLVSDSKAISTATQQTVNVATDKPPAEVAKIQPAAAVSNLASSPVQWIWSSTNAAAEDKSKEGAVLPELAQKLSQLKATNDAAVSGVAANVQSTGAATNAAAFIETPKPGEDDERVAILQRKAENDDAEAQCELAEYYSSINDTKSALEWYRRAVAHDYPKGLCRYGQFLLKGKGIPVNEAKAAEMFKKAAALNDPEGQYLLGVCLLEGNGVSKNHEEAVQMFKYAAAQNDAASYCQLGECALYGVGMAKNVNQAMLYFKKAVELNFSPALYRMGEAYEKGLTGVPNPTTALVMFKKAAEMNNIKAQCYLVSYYDSKAKKTPLYRAEMVQRMCAAATNSISDARDDEEKEMLIQIYMLYGDCLMNGAYVAANPSEGIKYYGKAAKASHAEGLFKYGMCLFNGQGVDKNESEGFASLMAAADKEHPKAMRMVGECYLEGKGTAHDNEQARSWLNKAADHGIPEAEYKMGIFCLEDGLNKANSKKAFAWFERAANRGYEPAIEKVVECYEQSIGVTKDAKSLALWRSKLKKTQKK